MTIGMGRTWRYATVVGAVIVVMARSAHAQRVAPSGIRKDPALATVLSIIAPGAGQAYAGRPWKALGLFATYTAGLWLTREAILADRRERPLAFSPAMALSVSLGAWVASVAMAGEDARRGR